MLKKNPSWHSIRPIVFITLRGTGEYCLWERCVSSWISYGLKRGIPGYFFGFSLFLLVFMSYCSWKSSTCSGLESHHHNLFSMICFLVYICLYYYYYVFLMFTKNIIMAQDQINYMNNTKEYWWVLLGIKFCQLIEHLRPKQGNPLSFFGFSLYFIHIMSS